jgi:NAD+ kinase
MPTAAIISKPNKPELAEVLAGVVDWLRRHKYNIVVDQESAGYLAGEQQVPREELSAHNPDFAIVMGGDGTLLAAARAVAHAGIPLLAVNLGSLGFLTEVSLSELYEHLRSIADRCCVIDERAMLHCTLWRNGTVAGEYDALNDVVLRSTAARLADFDLSIDSHHVADYKADALIIATPTGSTAYSLAAGGPILVPSVRAFVITPVSPHALTHRPLVVEESSRIMISVLMGQEEASLALDGQVSIALESEDRVECRLAEDRVKLVRTSNGYKFFEILRNKLHWGER